MIKRWLHRVGVACMVGGLALFLLADFLPVEFLHGFSWASSEHTYYRVVPSAGTDLPTAISLALLVAGLALFAVSHWWRK
jgi:hypothetical protein